MSFAAVRQFQGNTESPIALCAQLKLTSLRIYDPPVLLFTSVVNPLIPPDKALRTFQAESFSDPWEIGPLMGIHRQGYTLYRAELESWLTEGIRN